MKKKENVADSIWKLQVAIAEAKGNLKAINEEIEKSQGYLLRLKLESVKQYKEHRRRIGDTKRRLEVMQQNFLWWNVESVKQYEEHTSRIDGMKRELEAIQPINKGTHIFMILSFLENR